MTIRPETSYINFNQGVFFKTSKIWESRLGKKGDFFEVLPKKLTIQNFDDWIYHPYKTGSLFKEAWRPPFTLTPGQIRFKRSLKQMTLTDERYHKNVFDALIKIVERNWIGGLNVVAHSGGYDSRLLGQVIKELGYDNVLFVECSGEGPEFKKIMKAQGFKDYMVYNEHIHPNDYHEYSLTFDPSRYDGLVGYPMNQWYDPWKNMVEQGIIPADSKFFRGPGAYIEKMFKRYGFMDFCKREYGWQISRFGFYGNQCIPWLDPEYIYELNRHRKIHADKRHRVTDRLCDVYCGHLAHIKGPGINEEVKQRGFRHLSDRLMNRITDEYKNSWFGKRYPIEPSNFIEYSRWWGYWNASQICEYLIKKGHTIENNNAIGS